MSIEVRRESGAEFVEEKGAQGGAGLLLLLMASAVTVGADSEYVG